ncbi:MAG: DUF5668 domain-containing protein [Clostridia bacterium]|nr:DUF5668 domain-containing protein [Clostridia bacterium]
MKGRNILGIILIAAGIGIILQKLHILEFGLLIGSYWPMIIIVIIAVQLIKKLVPLTTGLFLMIIAAYIQLKKSNILPINLSEYFWPILIILFGFWIIFARALENKKPEISDNTIDHFVMFSGIENKNISQQFSGGNIFAIFGGADIDLRGAQLAEEEVVLDLTTIFGGIEIKVPDNWRVEATGIPIFGGWSNNTDINMDVKDAPLLKVKCLVLFGGIDIKN